MSNVTSMWRYVYRKLRQSLCPHRVSVGDIRRVSEAQVECPCLRCGKVLRAPYGLLLNAKDWTQ